MAKSKKKTELLSLFCGAGGLDFGFEKAGYESSLAFDIRPDAINSYNHNRRKKAGQVADIADLNLAELDQAYGKEFRPYGVIGGPPCQSFSVSNVHVAEDDPRHELPMEYARLLSELNSRNPLHFFVFENVMGLKNARNKTRFLRFLEEFRNAGFNVFSESLNAKNYSVPQNRERLFVVGLNKVLYPEIAWEKPKGSNKILSVRDAISNLPEPLFYSSELKSADIPYHKNHWCMVPRSKKFTTPGAFEPGKNGRSFRILSWDKPSPTVAYGNREVHVHPNGNRRLSVFEAMTLQGFPTNYELLGTLSSQIQQVSEAVPPPLARSIATSIKSLLKL